MSVNHKLKQLSKKGKMDKDTQDKLEQIYARLMNEDCKDFSDKELQRCLGNCVLSNYLINLLKKCISERIVTYDNFVKFKVEQLIIRYGFEKATPIENLSVKTLFRGSFRNVFEIFSKKFKICLVICDLGKVGFKCIVVKDCERSNECQYTEIEENFKSDISFKSKSQDDWVLFSANILKYFGYDA